MAKLYYPTWQLPSQFLCRKVFISPECLPQHNKTFLHSKYSEPLQSGSCPPSLLCTQTAKTPISYLHRK